VFEPLGEDLDRHPVPPAQSPLCSRYLFVS
jgi:hypothetical protein